MDTKELLDNLKIEHFNLQNAKEKVEKEYSHQNDILKTKIENLQKEKTRKDGKKMPYEYGLCPKCNEPEVVLNNMTFNENEDNEVGKFLNYELKFNAIFKDRIEQAEQNEGFKAGKPSSPVHNPPFDQAVIDIQNDGLDEQLIIASEDHHDMQRYTVKCGICCKDIQQNEKTNHQFKCSHTNFHFKCAEKWLKKKKHCPICKK